MHYTDHVEGVEKRDWCDCDGGWFNDCNGCVTFGHRGEYCRFIDIPNLSLGCKDLRDRLSLSRRLLLPVNEELCLSAVRRSYRYEFSGHTEISTYLWGTCDHFPGCLSGIFEAYADNVCWKLIDRLGCFLVEILDLEISCKDSRKARITIFYINYALVSHGCRLFPSVLDTRKYSQVVPHKWLAGDSQVLRVASPTVGTTTRKCIPSESRMFVNFCLHSRAWLAWIRHWRV